MKKARKKSAIAVSYLPADVVAIPTVSNVNGNPCTVLESSVAVWADDYG